MAYLIRIKDMFKYWECYGQNIYILLLHANFLDEPASFKVKFSKDLLSAVESIPDEVLLQWINSGAWREALTSSWIIGILKAEQFFEKIKNKLLDSETCYAGQGYCLAMAQFGSKSASEVLVQYLNKYLPAMERQYDQEWAIGSLVWLDKKMKTENANVFLENLSLWQLTGIGGKYLGKLSPVYGIERIERIMDFL